MRPPDRVKIGPHRYGVVFEASIADEAHRMLEAAEVPGWLEFIACRCT